MNEEDVFFGDSSLLSEALEEGAVIVLHVFLQGGGHYILITGKANGICHAFDPYYAKTDPDQEGLFAVKDHPDTHNLDIAESLLNDISGKDYSMGAIKTREALISPAKKVQKGLLSGTSLLSYVYEYGTC